MSSRFVTGPDWPKLPYQYSLVNAMLIAENPIASDLG